MRATPLRRPSAVSQSVRLGYVGRSGCHRHLRPYLHENTASRPISKVKHGRDSLVLSWETRWESGLLQFSSSFLHPFLSRPPLASACVGMDGRPSASRSRRRRRGKFWVCSHKSPGVEAYAGCPGEGDPWPSVGCRAHGHLQRTTALTKAEGESSLLLGHICWMRATPLWEAVFRGEGDPR